VRGFPAKVLFALCLSAAILSGFAVHAPQAFAQQENSASSAEPESPAQQLTEESREAAGEGGTAQFKHSSPVRWLSRVTGLGLEASYLAMMGVNFLIIVGVIYWLSKKNLPAAFRARTASIQKAMEEARQASADAKRRLAEIEARLSKLDVEIAEMRATAEKETAAEEQRIKASAEADARKVLDTVEQEITAAVRTARRELTAYAADLAVTLARKQIHVDPATDQNILQYFAGQLSNGDKSRGA
jgi:F-type H+-transporting ATPase subunit b